MKEHVQFSGFKLIPRRLDPSAKGATQDLKNASDIEEIDRARETFHRSSKTRGAKPEGRRTRDEKAFISKPKFILSHRDFTLLEDPEDVLISLLADSSTLFSRQYQVHEMNHPFFKDLRSEHGKTETEELQGCKDYALRDVQKDDKKELYKHILSKLEEKATLEGRKVAAYRKKRDLLWSTLEEWCPDVQLTPAEKDSFLVVLSDYFSRLKSISVEKQAAGHHVPSYMEIDSIRCKEYLKKKHRLEEVIRRHKAWKPGNPEQLFREGYTYYYKKNKAAVCSKLISQALTDFLGKPCEADEALECMVRRAERIKNIDADLFPFHYLMVIVADQHRLFSTPNTLSSGRIIAACDSPYNPKLSKLQQRIKRIRLLHDLNVACGLSRETRSKNWNLFLGVHGTRIESRDEFDLWKSIIYPEGSEKPEEDIPVMELMVLCLDCLETCMSNQIETLYCYHSGSPMHQGHFIKFIEQHPDVLNACVKRVEQKDWTKYKRKYLQEWGRLNCDPDAIQDLCGERAGLIRWGSISEDLDTKLKDFCRTAYSAIGRNSVSPEGVETSVQELKSLLVETAFRTILKQETVAVLAGQAERLLNGEGYQICVTDLEWL